MTIDMMREEMEMVNFGSPCTLPSSLTINSTHGECQIDSQQFVRITCIESWSIKEGVGKARRSLVTSTSLLGTNSASQLNPNQSLSTRTHPTAKMPTALVVGATRGLGYELAKQFVTKGYTTYGTARSPPKDVSNDINWITNVDIADPSAGKTIVDGLSGQKPDIIFIVAGFLPKESLDKPDFDAEVKTYKICSIGPVFVVSALHNADLLKKGAKILLISSEAGSITLRHPSEGGGMYAHHGSKAATNMVGKLLSLDLKDAGVAVGMLHPGFMRTEMTRSVGFDKFWEDGGAVTPDVAAGKILEWVDGFDIGKSGTF